MALQLGAKLFQYKEDGTPEVIRLLEIDNAKGMYKCYRERNGSVFNIKQSEVQSNWNLLTPDGIFGFMRVITTEYMPDVVVTFARTGTDTDSNLPYIICRQNVYDFFGNIGRNPATDDILVGISVTQDTIPAGINFKDLLKAKEIIDYEFCYGYLDDNLSDIFKFITTRRYDNHLRQLWSGYDHSTPEGHQFIGYSRDLKEMLEVNNFMRDFRSAFGILFLPGPVVEENEGLSEANKAYLGQLLNKTITETYLIRYTKEIDTRSIRRNWVLVSSLAENLEKVYIVGYDVVE